MSPHAKHTAQQKDRQGIGRRCFVAVAVASTMAFAGANAASAAGGSTGLPAIDRPAVEALPQPSAAALPSSALSTHAFALPYGTTTLDAFEGALWPDPTRWLYDTDLNRPGTGTRWSPSTCQAKGGSRGLRANGATPAGPPTCAAPYEGSFTASTVLALDLSNVAGAATAELAFDLWMDAEPNEGLIVAYLRPEAPEGYYVRHILYSGTGRVRRWIDGGVRLDLASARDVYDGAWRGDLRGKQVLIEFIFLSADGSADAQGAYLDNVVFRATPPVGPTPPPGAVERTTACTGVRDCGSVGVFAYVDVGCDRRFRRGTDVPLAMQPRVDVVAGADVLGARLGKSGRLTFQYPLGRDASFSLAVPDGYALCPDSPNPVDVPASAFNRFRRTSVEFRLQRP
ncbi:MAG: hypothetical protein IPG72_05125 [Ardenticatenales bacterium]|jgi:hypothetical protein|nr:hypothetical protein [Ardenticatenales bacterium]